MNTKFPLNRKVRIAFGSAIAVLLLVGVLSFRAMVASGDSDGRVRHTHEVLEHLQELLVAMGSIQSSALGFALTGKESYLETYSANALRVDEEQAIIGLLTKDNSAQQRQLPALARLSAEKIERAAR